MVPASSISKNQPCTQSNVVAGTARIGASAIASPGNVSTDVVASVGVVAEFPQATKTQHNHSFFICATLANLNR